MQKLEKDLEDAPDAIIDELRIKMQNSFSGVDSDPVLDAEYEKEVEELDNEKLEFNEWITGRRGKKIEKWIRQDKY